MKPPDYVEQKLAELKSHAEALSTLAQSSMGRAEAARKSLGELRMARESRVRLMSLPVAVEPASYSPPPAAEVSSRESEPTVIHELEATIASSVAEATQRRAVASRALQIHLACRAWVDRLPDSARLTQAQDVQLSRNGNLAHLLEVVRSEIDTTLRRRKATQQAPLPIKTVQERAEAWVTQQAAKCSLVVNANPFDVRFGVSWADANTTPQLLPLICKLLPKAVVAEIVTSASCNGRQDGAMTDLDRTKAMTSLTEKLLQLERNEEALVTSLLNAGQFVERRQGASPQAVLQVVLSTRVAVATPRVAA